MSNMTLSPTEYDILWVIHRTYNFVDDDMEQNMSKSWDMRFNWLILQKYNPENILVNEYWVYNINY